MTAGGSVAKTETIHTDNNQLLDEKGGERSEVQRYYEIARMKVRKKRFSEALDALDEVLKANPFHIEALLLRAISLEDIGHLEDSKNLFEKIILNFPDCSSAYREFGRFLLFSENSPATAETQLLRGLTKNPQDAFAHALLAEVYVRTGRHRQALLHLEIASRFRTEEIRYFEVCAKVLARLEKSMEKTKDLQQTLFSHAGNRAERAFFRRAIRAERKGKKERPAIKRYFRKVWF
ncbi:tetratricopeptide repeat protein [Melghirimyces algeriensis]|uniref:Tetratricopeptide repeat-containing protein n=1 Tax=Melghirimyces algeriensis TaxID=910412 RepID=A0A521CJA6_9BACL|nr:tetratricopeptide repeat protein [Melghirimyces algeriensis]SMO59518.1 Tetratricopeptide repeat-containing protein [Melghirimyces algeriensis]